MSDVHAESAENHHASRKFLTFLVDAVSYAVHIRHVVEIIGMQHITPLPGAPPHIRGVIILRGAVIPVMDLHARFGLPPFAYNDRTCIVVVEVDHIKEGLIVDTVSEVLDMPLSNVESTPEMGRDPGTTLVEVIGKVGDEVRLILDIRRVLGIAPAPVRAAA